MTLSPRLRIVLSMVIFGTISLFVRAIPIPSAELAMLRAVLACGMLLGYFAFRRKKGGTPGLNFRGMGRQLPVLLFSGAAMAFNWILLFEAYRYTTVAVATLSYYFAPVLVTVACPLLFHEKMGWRQWLCFGMSTLGIALITGLGDLSAGSSHLTGILFGLGAAVLYATVVLLNKRIRGVDGLQRTFLQFAAASAVLLPYVLLTTGFSFPTLNAGGLACLLVVGLVHTGLAYCLYFPALEKLPGQEAALLSYIDPLTAVLISVTILQEPLSLLQLIGGALILGFTLFNELAPAEKKSA